MCETNYKNFIASHNLQKRLGKLFIEKAKVMDFITPLSIVGMPHTGQILAAEIARGLKREHYAVPVEPHDIDDIIINQWKKDISDLLSNTILLVDSILIDKDRINQALKLITDTGIRSIILFAAILYKPALHGNRYPFKRGIFLKSFDTPQEARLLLEDMEQLSESELSRRFSNL